MNLTKRQTALLNVLRKNNGVCTGKDLSIKTGISLRTVQTEMKYLKKEGIVISSPSGYSLADKIININTAHPSNADNDCLVILKKLLSHDIAYNLDDFAEELFISKSALRSRLKVVESAISADNLHFVFEKNTVHIEGTELNKRRMFRRMIISDIPHDYTDIDNFSDYFEDLDLTTTQKIILDSIHEEGYYIQSPYSSGLLLGITIGLYRIFKGIHTPDSLDYDESSNEVKLAKRICDQFYNYCKKEATHEDVFYIATLFQGQINRNPNIALQTNPYATSFEGKISTILNAVLEDYLIVADVTPFVHSLSAHLYEMIKRCHAKNYVENHMHESLRESSPFIYDVAVSFAKRLETAFQIGIPDDEIGFISVHIGLIIENDIGSSNCIKILLLSNNYHNIADKIKSQILNHHGKQVSIYIMNPSRQTVETNVDLIIATSAIDVIGKNVIEISPFYSIVDQARVDAAISNALKERELSQNHRQLVELFSPNLFFIDDSIKTSGDAIRFLSKKLTNFGVVNRDFFEGVMEREKLSPTCFFDAFAIPHSIHMNASSSMIAVLINKKGIEWNNTTIQLCIMIAMSKENRNQFSNTYNGIVQILCDQSRLRKLINSSSLSEFLKNLK